MCQQSDIGLTTPRYLLWLHIIYKNDDDDDDD
jgi:hypothetical protein